MKKAILPIVMFLAVGVQMTFGQAPALKEIGATEFKNLMKGKDVVIMDVRTPAEVSEGFIKGTTVFADVNGTDFMNQIAKLDKNKTYLVYCRSGMRSRTAGNTMIRQGFKNVYSMLGGIMGYDGEIIKK